MPGASEERHGDRVWARVLLELHRGVHRRQERVSSVSPPSDPCKTRSPATLCMIDHRSASSIRLYFLFFESGLCCNVKYKLKKNEWQATFFAECQPRRVHLLLLQQRLLLKHHHHHHHLLQLLNLLLHLTLLLHPDHLMLVSLFIALHQQVNGSLPLEAAERQRRASRTDSWCSVGRSAACSESSRTTRGALLIIVSRSIPRNRSVSL